MQTLDTGANSQVVVEESGLDNFTAEGTRYQARYVCIQYGLPDFPLIRDGKRSGGRWGRRGRGGGGGGGGGDRRG